MSDPQAFMQFLLETYESDKIKFAQDQKIKLFGFAEIDTECPEELYDRTNNFPPLFVKGPILERGEHLQNLHGLFKAHKVVLITPYIQWLVSIGYRIAKVYRIWEYENKPVLKSFNDRAVEERKKGDTPGDNPMLAISGN